MEENRPLFRVHKINIGTAGSKVINDDCRFVYFSQYPNFTSFNIRVKLSTGGDRFVSDEITLMMQNSQFKFKNEKIKQIYVSWDSTAGNTLQILTSDDLDFTQS